MQTGPGGWLTDCTCARAVPPRAVLTLMARHPHPCPDTGTGNAALGHPGLGPPDSEFGLGSEGASLLSGLGSPSVRAQGFLLHQASPRHQAGQNPGVLLLGAGPSSLLLLSSGLVRGGAPPWWGSVLPCPSPPLEQQGQVLGVLGCRSRGPCGPLSPGWEPMLEMPSVRGRTAPLRVPSSS